MEHQCLEDFDRSGIFEAAQLFDGVLPSRSGEVEIEVRKGLGRRLERVEWSRNPRMPLTITLSLHGLNQSPGGVELGIDPSPDQVADK